MLVTATVDSESLAPHEERQLRDLVETADFFELPNQLTSPTPGADRFVYILTVESEGRSHTVETSDAAAPSTLRPLLDWLTTIARRE